nr:MAG TPA: hypothetical protein [Caudoviricetes sp.]
MDYLLLINHLDPDVVAQQDIKKILLKHLLKNILED